MLRRYKIKSDYGKKPRETGFGEGIKNSKGRYFFCDKCKKLYKESEGCCVRNEKVSTFYIPDQSEKFNLGLGRVCANNARATEKMAKSLGLVPIGDNKLPEAKPHDFTGSSYKEIVSEYRKIKTLGKVG